MSKDPDCIFCKIIAGDIPCFRIYEDEDTLAFMDINPANEGHCLVITKEHAANLYKVSDAAISAAARSAKKVAAVVNAVVGPDGINLVQANGEGAEQSVFHFHLHVMPRRIGDELKMNWGHHPGDMERIKALGEEIAAAIGD
ncbi:MAG: HIT domain-containing protein [Alphaproteobacteria bacterium]|nr:HIT domain-containing protein [Alphaproteobacteria bacterium]